MTRCDVLIVGARCSGAALAMLLARKGAKLSLSIARNLPATRFQLISCGRGPRHSSKNGDSWLSLLPAAVLPSTESRRITARSL